jgi:hypothetical protein
VDLDVEAVVDANADVAVDVDVDADVDVLLMAFISISTTFNAFVFKYCLSFDSMLLLIVVCHLIEVRPYLCGATLMTLSNLQSE